MYSRQTMIEAAAVDHGYVHVEFRAELLKYQNIVYIFQYLECSAMKLNFTCTYRQQQLL